MNLSSKDIIGLLIKMSRICEEHVLCDECPLMDARPKTDQPCYLWVLEHPEEAASAMGAEDNIDHPAHYNTGEIEVIDYIRDKLGALDISPYEGYCLGNVLKYVSRYPLKGGVEDLKKAQVYLGWMIDWLEVQDAD